MASGKLRIYGLGGCGISLISPYVGVDTEDHCAEILPAFFDTSRSALKKGVPENLVYTIDGVDGSGKVRRENADPISDNINRFLLEHKPANFNLVVFSGSGGTGATSGCLLIAELLKRGETVMGIVIGSEESDITINNTLKTLKSLEGISKTIGKPVNIMYRHNGPAKTRREVDSDINVAIAAIAILASREVRYIDTKDIENWLMFDKVTSMPPRLAAVEIFDDSHKTWKDYSPITMISMYQSDADVQVEVVPEYNCTGYIDGKFTSPRNLHFITDVTLITKYASYVKKVVDNLEEARRSRTKVSSLLTDSDKPTDNGMVY